MTPVEIMRSATTSRTVSPAVMSSEADTPGRAIDNTN